MRFENGGARARAIPCHGETVVVRPGKTVDCAPRDGWLDAARRKLLEDYDVSITDISMTADEQGASGQSDQDRKTRLVDIIQSLDTDKDFTKGGKPEVDAINELLDEGEEQVSAAERDTLWEALKQAQSQ